MNKELDEAWTTIYHYNDEIIHDLGSEYVENPLKEEIEIVNNALLELKAIDNAKPSEALENITLLAFELGTSKDIKFAETRFPKMLLTIKQALIKAQEQEKVLEIIKKNQVSTFWINECKSVEEYNGVYGRKLTQEEYDLLKRWLG